MYVSCSRDLHLKFNIHNIFFFTPTTEKLLVVHRSMAAETFRLCKSTRREKNVETKFETCRLSRRHQNESICVEPRLYEQGEKKYIERADQRHRGKSLTQILYFSHHSRP